MLERRTDTRLQALELVNECVHRPIPFERSTLAWAHGNVPLDRLFGTRPAMRALITRIGKGICLLAMKQAGRFDYVCNIARGVPHGRRQPRVGINSDVSLHAKVPMVAFLALVHLQHVTNPQK